MRADVCVILAVCTRDVSVEFAAVLEGGVAAFPATDECLWAELAGVRCL